MEQVPHFVDMASDQSDNESALGAGLSPPKYPYGLMISLNDETLQKLGLDGECDVGDILHGHFLAEVTSVSKNKSQDGESNSRVELQIIMMTAMEDEDSENREVDAENEDEE